MFENTETITIDSTPYILTRVDATAGVSKYIYTDTIFELTMQIRQTESTKNGIKTYRHNVELVHVTYATATEAEIRQKCYVVMERTIEGALTVAELQFGLESWLGLATILRVTALEI